MEARLAHIRTTLNITDAQQVTVGELLERAAPARA